MAEQDQTGGPRRLLSPGVFALAVGLPLVLVVGMIIVGRNVVGDTGIAQDEPLAVVELPQPDAGTPGCEAFTGALPDELSDAMRVEITEPAPPATAAYRLENGDPVVVRCGTLEPPTFDAASVIQMVNDVQWFHEKDPEEMIPESTWVTVDRAQTVTLTMPRETDSGPIQAVSDIIVEHLEEVEPDPAPVE